MLLAGLAMAAPAAPAHQLSAPRAPLAALPSLHAASQPTDAPDLRSRFSEPESTFVRMGLSPGSGDRYGAQREFQFVDDRRARPARRRRMR